MKDIISVVTDVDFWIIVALVLVVVVVFYTVLGDTFSSLRKRDDDKELAVFEVVPEPLEVGCHVYDIYTGDVGQFCGTHLGDDNNVYAVVVIAEDNLIYYYYCVAESLLRIKLV